MPMPNPSQACSTRIGRRSIGGNLVGAGQMPRCWADRAIMFCVIGLVAWAIIVLPIVHSFSWPSYQPAQAPTNQHPPSEGKDEEPWLTKDAAGFFTFMLFGVGAIQVFLFVWQLWLIRESLDDAKVAADAAKEGADAARESAETAKASMVASNRAYVLFNGCRWISHRQDDLSPVFWRIRARWINSGNSPPRNLRVYAHYE